jgi:hypothetical protein
VVEALFSYVWLFRVFGDVAFADRAELLVFNALPAAMSPDMWGRVYLQQANMVGVGRTWLSSAVKLQAMSRYDREPSISY